MKKVKLPHFRVIIKNFDNKTYYVTQINYRNGFGWWNITHNPFDQEDMEFERLKQTYVDKIDPLLSFYHGFKNQQDAQDYADTLYEYLESKFDGYVKIIQEREAKKKLLPKNGTTVYRRPPSLFQKLTSWIK